MKAYKVYDIDEWYSTIVFAETAGKAKALALHTDTCMDSEFTRIRARRVPKADKLYQDGKFEIDWYNDKQRLFLVKELGWSCWDASDECDNCIARQYCKAEWLESEEDNDR